MDSGVSSADESFNDHHCNLEEEHHNHVDGKLVSVLKNLSASSIQVSVVVDKVDANDELPECDSSIVVLARLLLLDQREKGREII